MTQLPPAIPNRINVGSTTTLTPKFDHVVGFDVFGRDTGVGAAVERSSVRGFEDRCLVWYALGGGAGREDIGVAVRDLVIANCIGMRLYPKAYRSFKYRRLGR